MPSFCFESIIVGFIFINILVNLRTGQILHLQSKTKNKKRLYLLPQPSV